MDNGSSHRGQRRSARLQAEWNQIIPAHTSWLSQIEIHVSIIRREALTPNSVESAARGQARLLQFQQTV